VADTYNSTIRKITNNEGVSTLAGLADNTGSTNGVGSNARFNYPFAVAVDALGIVYVADTYNSTIRKITAGGLTSTFAGLAGNSGSADGTNSLARFNLPQGIAVDNRGNVYVADTGNNTIRKITTNGVVSTLAGLAGNSGDADGTGINARFDYPTGVAIDGAGDVYVADHGNNTIRKILSDGSVSTLAGLVGGGSSDGTGTDAQFWSPSGMAVDSDGNVYIADTGNNTIRVGRIGVFGIPSLQIYKSVNQMILSWPKSGLGYVLEANATLTPATSWSVLTNAPGTAGLNFILTNNIIGTPRFYRLHKP
jgi:sugar lactone lactonase YvrE